jgi:hypothetical protein
MYLTKLDLVATRPPTLKKGARLKDDSLGDLRLIEFS